MPVSQNIGERLPSSLAQGNSFTNYVFQFSKLLVEWRDAYPAAINVIGIPYRIFLYGRSSCKAVRICV